MTTFSKTSWYFFTWKTIVFKTYRCKNIESDNFISKLNFLLPHSSLLLTVYKCFVRSHLDYGDAVYDQPNLFYLPSKNKQVQYIVGLATMSAIRGNSKNKLYQEVRK